MSALSFIEGHALGLLIGYAAGIFTPGIIRKVRAFLFGTTKKIESIGSAVKKDVQKL